MRASPILLAAALALAGCVANPVVTPEWPIGVAPAAGRPDRLVVVAPECGAAPATTPEPYGNSWHNQHLGLGCSQARNLALQVAEPRDLVQGRTAGRPDAEREARAIDRYHKGEEKDLRREGTRSSFSGGGGGGQ